MRTLVDTGTYGEYLHYGMPLALVTVCDESGCVNVSTNISISPLPGNEQRLVIGVLKENLTNKMLAATGEFVVNVITKDMRGIAHQCGTYSGKDVDKIAVCGLTTLPATYVKPPLIAECPLNIECKVEAVHHLDDLDLFIAKILAVEVAPEWSNGRGGIDLNRYQPLIYAFGHTFALGPQVGISGL